MQTDDDLHDMNAYPKRYATTTRRTIMMAIAKRAIFSHFSTLRRKTMEFRLLRLKREA